MISEKDVFGRANALERAKTSAISKPKAMAPLSLIGDIGATNARFALVDAGGNIHGIRISPCRDHASLADALEAYLAAAGSTVAGAPMRPTAAAIAVAGPVTDDRVTFVNQPWSFSQTELKSKFKLDRLLIVNDFAALSAGVPYLAATDRQWIGGEEVSASYVPKTIIGVLGPGTGLGVGRVVPIAGVWVAVPGEGGHASLAATTERESEVLAVMRRHFGHVSAERALSGPGLVNLYSALAELDGATPKPYVPQQVTEMAISGNDPHCREALGMFAEMLGTVASNLALAFGAKGGIYIGGGIVPRLGLAFPAQRFRQRFEQKGRLSPYIADIPSFIIRHPFPAFVGLAAILRNASLVASHLD